MNERIDQLAREAGFKHPDHVGLCEEYAYFDHVRFAELIVRECARVIDRGDGEMSSQAETIWCNVCRDDILKHFGVE